MTVPLGPGPSTSTPASPRPALAQVFSYAAGQIHRAAADLWPGLPVHLEDHVPSVTGYVRRVRVGGRPLYAKVSFLGISLVSLLRGVRGDWPAVRAAQEEYVRGHDSLLDREAAQLRYLAGLGRPQVCALAGVRTGVLFTEPVTGPTLADMLLLRPADTGQLLAGVLDELSSLHRFHRAHRPDQPGVIGERSIAGTFLRKFNGISGRTYLAQLGTERCPADQRQTAAELLSHSVGRLHRLRLSLLPAPRSVLAYGDLKPEHVLFPGGADARPVLLDPGLLHAGPVVDTAKLISRTVLLLAAHRPSPETASRTVQGLAAFAEERTTLLSRPARRVWLRELMVLWLMDTVNILTTFLSAPAALPLPVQALALLERAERVCGLLEAASADLVTGTEPHRAWEHVLERVGAVAS